TPQLLWGGGPRPPERDLPAVVPVSSSGAGAPAAAAAKPTGEEPAGGGAAAASGARSAVVPTPGASGDTGDPANSAAAPPSPQVLLQDGWRLTGHLRQRTGGSSAVVDHAPRLFEELIDRLRAAEILAPDANGVTPAELSNWLLPTVVPLRAI